MKLKIPLMLIIPVFFLINMECNKNLTAPEDPTEEISCKPKKEPPTKNILYGIKYIPGGTDSLYKMNLDSLKYESVAPLSIRMPDGYDGLDFDIDGTLYLGVAATGNLYKIDTTTGAATFVINIPLSYSRIMECIAFAPVKVPGPDSVFPAGTLFGSEHGNLHAINIKTGTVQFIGETGHDDDALDFSKKGILYGIDGAKSLYTINTRTAESKEIIANPLGWGNLTFAPDGFLYSAYWRVLYRLDPATGNIDSLYYLVQETAGLASIP
jgi:outer membrane protein assembly factor BamB